MKPTSLRSFIALTILVFCLMGVTGCFHGRDEPRHDDHMMIDHHDDHHDDDHR